MDRSDICRLIKTEEYTDANGYTERRDTLVSEVLCRISVGTTITEFYEAQKAGIKISATAEIWEDEYNNEQLLEWAGKRYKIIRAKQTATGTLKLSLEEVVH